MVNSRKELVTWFNELGIQINRIEDLGKGTAICQLLAQIHPDFPSSYIRNPSNDYEYLKNMKVIQAFFILNKIEMYFPVDRLVKCKLQDNLEVAQKLYKYYVKVVRVGQTENVQETSSTNSKSVDSKSVDSKSVDSKSVDSKSVDSKSVDSKSVDSKSVDSKSVDSKSVESLSTSNSILTSQYSSIDRSSSRKEILDNLRLHREEDYSGSQRLVSKLEEENKKLREEVSGKDLEILKYKSLVGDLGSVKEILKSLEENRDFYFKKLVEVEKVLVEHEDIPEELKNILFEILYRKQE